MGRGRRKRKFSSTAIALALPGETAFEVLGFAPSLELIECWNSAGRVIMNEATDRRRRDEESSIGTQKHR